MALWMWCCTCDFSNFFQSFVVKCTDPDCCCGCCSAFRPRYKRLVDNIFPVNPQDGLVKSNMEKLTFYSLSSPEKLDRIGEYLYQKAARDVYRRRYGFVVIAVEAMDQLLLACHAPTLNLFVESFLRMIQKLLESTEPEMQILATQSFVKFANIEEDTPSYHRRYDFFISKFGVMCHSGEVLGETRIKIRIAGIRGIQAVVRKTVTDDLVENIWEPVHMDKIVPSLLFNMQDGGGGATFTVCQPDGVITVPKQSSSSDDDNPPQLAEACLRELVRRASFAHIRAVLRPVLRHFDLHALWVPNYFAIHTFRIIIFSIQAQYSYTVVEGLMGHLDANVKSTAAIRTSIAGVLAKIIAIAAEESVGPSVLEIINSLLNHLRDSVKHGTSLVDEKHYQEALINALGEFANHLPDYQKIEIMLFIMGKIPFPLVDSHTPADNLLQSILLKSLLKVGTKYQTIHLTTTFPPSFLEPLLRMSLAPDPEMRLLVQRIFHTLIDRHHNLDKLTAPTIHADDLDLTIEKLSRPDLIFITKYGTKIYNNLYVNLQLETNSYENIKSAYTTLALLCIELVNEDTLCDYLQLVFGIQSLATNATSLGQEQRYYLHVLVPCLLQLIVLKIRDTNRDLGTALASYTNDIIEGRTSQTPHLLPPLQLHYDDATTFKTVTELPHLLIDFLTICDLLTAAGLNTEKLQRGGGPAQYSTISGGGVLILSGSGSGANSPHQQHRHSIMWHQPDSVQEVAPPGHDDNTTSSSANSSPGVKRHNPTAVTPSTVTAVNQLPSELNFDSMKRVLTAETSEARRSAEAERRRELTYTFKTASFTELMKRTEPKHGDLQEKLNAIFNTLNDQQRVHSKHEKNVHPSTITNNTNIPMYEVNFPELFFY